MIRTCKLLPAAWCLLSVVSLPCLAATEGDRRPYVAGMAPHVRPVNAPVIREVKQTLEWRQKALQGIGEPVPASLKFLNDQGAWYTPFDRAGMPGYYDLRQMHVVPAKTKP